MAGAVVSFDVDALPARVAHAVHALMYASQPSGGARSYGPFTAAEVCEFDAYWEALTPRYTGAALREAAKLGLAVYVPGASGYWTPTNAALEHRREFEERFLRDEEIAERAVRLLSRRRFNSTDLGSTSL